MADERSVLVAGIGNVFLGDDGFGVEVVNALDRSRLPAGVGVVDYGIRGVHLAYDLLDGRYDALVMVDAVPLDEPPGTLAVLDISGYDARSEFAAWADDAVDAHAMKPEAVLVALHKLGGHVDRVYVLGCRPSTVGEGMGLTAPVRAAVEPAVAMLGELLAEIVGDRAGAPT
jgi:hydrogenase maturation protease